MKLLSFRGGIHPPEQKLTAEKAIEPIPLPTELVIPLRQHIGAECKCLVNKKDEVIIGQPLTQAEGFVAAPVHSPVCGVVKDIKLCPTLMGQVAMCVIITPSQAQDKVQLTGQGPMALIKEAGIIGMGGAAFPTHVKLSPPKDKPITALLINGAECEPYLTCDYRLMLEHTEQVLSGIDIVMGILGIKSATIGIEANKPKAISLFQEQIKSTSRSGITVQGLKCKYPQGFEKSLIKAITGRNVPAGGLPMDVGALCINIGTLVSIHEAVHNKMPPAQRVVTVTGDVVKPGNYLVPIGTRLSDLISHAGGFKGEPRRIIAGGPMMGFAQHSLEAPIVKASGGVLVLASSLKSASDPCLRCGRCVNACVMQLNPVLINDFASKNQWEQCDKLGTLNCCECGSCTYVCPSKIPLVQMFKLAKAGIMTERAKAKAAQPA